MDQRTIATFGKLLADSGEQYLDLVDRIAPGPVATADVSFWAGVCDREKTEPRVDAAPRFEIHPTLIAKDLLLPDKGLSPCDLSSNGFEGHWFDKGRVTVRNENWTATISRVSQDDFIGDYWRSYDLGRLWAEQMEQSFLTAIGCINTAPSTPKFDLEECLDAMRKFAEEKRQFDARFRECLSSVKCDKCGSFADLDEDGATIVVCPHIMVKLMRACTVTKDPLTPQGVYWILDGVKIRVEFTDEQEIDDVSWDNLEVKS